MKYYTILIVIYYILTMLFPHDDPSAASLRILPQTVMGLLGVYSIYIYIVKFNKFYKEEFFRPYVLLLLISIIYILYPFGGIDVIFNNFINVIKYNMALLFMFTMLYLIKDEEDNKYVYIIYAIQVFYAFYQLYMDRFKFVMMQDDVFDSNAGFILICLLPMALMLPVPRLRLYLSAAIILGCIYSGQRSAALAATLCFPLCMNYLKKSIKLIDIFIFITAFVLLIEPVLQKSIENIQLRNEIDTDRGNFGSGRSEFWLIVWDAFWSGNIFQILFGYGTQTVQALLEKTYGHKMAAHNGWLDTLYSYGLLGTILYAKSIFIFLKCNKFINTKLPHIKNMCFILFILFFTKGITSHGYWDISVIPFTLVYTLIIFQIKNKKTKISCL